MSEPKILDLEKKIKELEKLIPTVLWEGETNNPNEITLSDSISNYKRLKIFFRDNNSQLRGVEIYTNNQNSIRVSLDSHYNQGQWFNLKMKSILITDKSIGGIGAAEYEFGSQTISYNNNIFIMKIEGYKN
jgi:hypothetical protein